jgi:glycosyltransferase involved in cell wall biosynthesis
VFGTKGCSIHVQEIIRALMERGADVELFAARVDGEPPQGLENVLVHNIPIQRGKEIVEREKSALAVNTVVREMLEQQEPFDMIYERYSLWSFAAMEFGRERNIPTVLEVNSPLIEEQAEHRALANRRGAERVAERVFGAAGSIVAVSNEVAKYVMEKYPRTVGRVHVVPNGVNPHRFTRDVASARSTHEPFTIGFVGTLKPWHGLSVLVDAFEIVHRSDNNMRLLIVGDGPERDAMVAELSERGLLSATHFTGAVAPEEIPPLLASMSVAIAPYQNLSHFYFSPLKVYEYMAAGVPVVASGIGQLNDLIRDGVSGVLCTPGDAGALARAIERLRDDDELRARIGQAGREDVLRNHTWDAVARRIIHLAGFESTVAHEEEVAA